MGSRRNRFLKLMAMFGGLLCGSQLASATTLDIADAERFAQLMNSDIPVSVEVIQENYLANAGVGVKSIMSSIQSAEKMHASISQASQNYTHAVNVCLPAAKAIEVEAKTMVARVALGTNTKPAKTISLVFGANNIAATASPSGIILALETLCQQAHNVEQAKALLLEYIAHEMVHVAQYQSTQRTNFVFNLLEMSLIEGTADFISSMYLDRPSLLQQPRKTWGEQHAAQLWNAFIEQQHNKGYGMWLYAPSTNEQPADMGYWMGSQIAEHYYNSAEDKMLAISTLLRMEDADALFRQSGVSAKTAHINVNNVELMYEDEGIGGNVVVFDAGFGTKHSVWQHVIDLLPMNIRTIAYTRAELTATPDLAKARTVEEHLSDLRALLTALAIDEPILYVTHSYSGMIAARYAEHYPDEIKGMVMVEPATFAQRKHFMQVDAEGVKKEDEMILGHMPAHLAAQYALIIEQMDKASASVKAMPATIPTAVFSAGNPSEQPFSITETKEGKPVWLALHKELVEGSEHQKQYIVDTDSHNIHKRNPEIIASQIIKMATQTTAYTTTYSTNQTSIQTTTQ